MAIETQGSSGESSEIFITRLRKMLPIARRSTSWQLFQATDFNGSSDRQIFGAMTLDFEFGATNSHHSVCSENFPFYLGYSARFARLSLLAII